VDPNRLCSDPDPGYHVHSDPDPAPDPNKFGSGSGSYQNFSNFLETKALAVIKIIVLILKLFFQLILRST